MIFRKIIDEARIVMLGMLTTESPAIRCLRCVLCFTKCENIFAFSVVVITKLLEQNQACNFILSSQIWEKLHRKKIFTARNQTFSFHQTSKSLWTVKSTWNHSHKLRFTWPGPLCYPVTTTLRTYLQYIVWELEGHQRYTLVSIVHTQTHTQMHVYTDNPMHSVKSSPCTAPVVIHQPVARQRWNL